jgi:hypothetical protein
MVARKGVSAMLRTIIIATTALLSFAPPVATGADEPEPIVASSEIEHVTVYPDRAAVERWARDIAVAPGVVRVVFMDLPTSLMQESVRASGEGTARSSIANVDVKRTYLGEVANARADSLERAYKKLERDRKDVLAKKEAYDMAGEFLKSIKAQAEQSTSGEVARGTADPAKLKGMFEFLRSAYADNRVGTIAIEESSAQLTDQMEALQREIQMLRHRPSDGSWTATVDLVVDTAGKVDVRLDYVATGASWNPSYDVRVSDDLKEIELTYYGQVSQRTGEDWGDVSIALATAEPALGVQIPTLRAWWLMYPDPVVAAADVQSSSSESKIDVKYEFKHREINTVADALSKEAGVIEKDGPLYVRGGRGSGTQYYLDGLPIADPFTAQPGSGITARFDVPMPQTLPSDGTVRRMTITTLDLEGDVAYESVPKLSPYAYLVAKVKNASEIPILAGATQVFLGAQFLGSGHIEDAPPAQEFDLSLGVDKAVKVERKLVRKERKEAARAGSDSRVEYVYRTEVENRRRVPIEIAVSDQFPVSQDHAIEIVRDKPSPEVSESSKEDGSIKWRRTLPAGAKEALQIGFEVHYPGGRPPVGLF